MRVKAIHFNHDTNSANSDALNIRVDADTTIDGPEWIDGHPPRPAAYTRDTLSRPITIQAAFSGGVPRSTIAIRAITERPNAGRRPESLADSPYVLSTVQAQDVTFRASGKSGPVTFTIKRQTPPPLVGVYDVRWTWQQKVNGRWIDFATTLNRIYVLAAVPRSPWTQIVSTVALPWVRVLEKACTWAAGATTAEQAEALIARELNQHPKLRYEKTARSFYDNGIANTYNLSFFLHELDTATEIFIDCRGTANALKFFANAVGANLSTLTIENSVADGTGVQSKDVSTFTTGVWAPVKWGWHELAWVPQLLHDSTGAPIPGGSVPGQPWPAGAGQEQLIYDAILQLKVPVNVPPETLPVRMRLGSQDVNDSGYRFYLVDTTNPNTNAKTVVPQIDRTIV